MAENNSGLQRLIDSLICYNEEHRLAICRPCGLVFPTHVASHLRNFHYALSKQERRAIIRYIDTLDTQLPEDVIKGLSSEIEIDAIDGLPIHDRIVCCEACQLLGAESTIIRHCQTAHNWTMAQSIFNVYLTNNCSDVDYTGSTNIFPKPCQILRSTKTKAEFLYY